MFTKRMHAVLAIVLCLCSLSWAQKYHTLDDDYDEDAALKNSETVKKQLKCFLEQGPCTNVQQSYRAHIMDALKDDCQYCTPQHKHNAKVFLHGIKEKFPDGYKEKRQNYDPDDELFPLFEDTVEKF